MVYEVNDHKTKFLHFIIHFLNFGQCNNIKLEYDAIALNNVETHLF